MYLLDTNVLSDAHKGVPEPARWLADADPWQIYVSVITLGEIERGIELVRTTKPGKARELAGWLNALRDDCQDRILTVTEDIAREWGRIAARRPRGDIDSLIAATAVVHGLTVVTRNVADFADTGAAVINPWQA